MNESKKKRRKEKIQEEKNGNERNYPQNDLNSIQ